MFKIISLEKESRIILLLLITAIYTALPLTVWSDDYTIGVKAGVSREVLDYEDKENNLILRGGVELDIPDTFSFNYTAIRNIDNETFSYSWNIQANGISDFINFTAGNYNLHFGSGLMMGRQSYSSGDPFSKKISIAKERTISPSNSGNPKYSLYGTVFEFYKSFQEIKINFIPFFSIQRRFISRQLFESGAIDSSLFSLNSKLEKNQNNTEPVNIMNYGGVFGFQTLLLFSFQLYYFETDLKGDSGKDILWDNDKYYSRNGVDLIKQGGFFAEYADNNISFFFEPAFSSIAGSEVVTDYAMAWGAGVQNHLMNFSVKCKNSGYNFHSEYSSGSRTPERIWELKCGIFPHKVFKTGFIVYTEKDLVPGYNKKYIEGSIEEEIYAAVNTDKIDIDMNFKRRENYSTDREYPINQGNLSASLSLSDRIYLKARSSVQKKDEGISGLGGCEVKYLFSGYMSLSLGYTRIIINGENPFYAMITPASEHSSITRFDESAHGGSVNLKYKKEKNSFYIRFTVTKKDTGRESDAESALSLFF